MQGLVFSSFAVCRSHDDKMSKCFPILSVYGSGCNEILVPDVCSSRAQLPCRHLTRYLMKGLFHSPHSIVIGLSKRSIEYKYKGLLVWLPHNFTIVMYFDQFKMDGYAKKKNL